MKHPKSASKLEHFKNLDSYTEEKNFLKEFTNDTTLHGLRNACNKSSNLFRRILWVSVILGMLVGCSVMMAQTIIKYLRYESVTSTTKLLNTSMDFPAITVCNSNIHKLSAVKQLYPESYRYDMLMQKMLAANQPLTDAEQLEVMTLQGELRKVSLGKFMEDVAYKPKEMFVNCYFQYGSIRGDCWNYLSPLYTDRGICQTFQSKEFVKKNGVAKIVQPGPNYGLTLTLNVMKEDYYFAFGLGYGMIILVHDQNVYPLMEQKGFAVSPGKETYVAIQKYITKRLSRPYSVQDCIDTTDERYEDYSREHCLFSCLAKEMYGNTCEYGTNETMTCTLLDAYIAEANLKIIGDVVRNCDCEPTCVETFYQYRVTAIDFPNEYTAVEASLRNWTTTNLTEIGHNYAHVKIYFDTFEYTINEQLPAMTINQIVADIGGELGLCLGASIITLAEFLDWGIIGIHFFARKLKLKSRPSQTKIQVISSITPCD